MIQLAAEPSFTLGAMEVRPATREAEVDGRIETLEPRVMQVLVVLARAGGGVVSRDALIEACWDGRAVSEDAVNRVIARLRRLSETAVGRSFSLETITKVGYRLTAAAAADTPREASEEASTPPEQAKPPSAPRYRMVIAGAVALLLCLCVAGVVLLWPKPSQVAPLTLAFMPFEDLSAGGQMAYAGEDLSREIRNTVSRVRGLQVLASSSSFAVDAEEVDARVAGARLGADLLLDGTIRIEGNTLRATAELIDADTGVMTWSQTYDGAATDFAAAERALSAALLETLVQRLGPDRLQLLTPKKQADRQTFLDVMEVRRLIRLAGIAGRDRDGQTAGGYAQAAERLLKEVLARDPDNADALEILAQMQERGIGGTANLSMFERRARGLETMRQALRADPDNPAALTTLGAAYRRSEWRWAEAEALFKRALAIDPNYADAHTWYAYHLSTVGRCREAVAHARAAKRLDPEFSWRRLGEPRTLKCAGQLELSARLYREEIVREPASVFLLREVGLRYIEQRNTAGMKGFIDFVRNTVWKGAPPEQVARELARSEAGVAAMEGKPDALLAMIAEDLALYERISSERNPGQGVSPDLLYTLALEAAAAGAEDQAIALLERAVRAGSLYIPETLPYGALEFTPTIRANPRYQAIWRNDPRLVELLKLRLAALKARQMEGVLPNGRVVKALAIAEAPLP